MSTPAEDVHWRRPAPTARQQRWDVLLGVLLALGTVGSMWLTRAAGLDDDQHVRPGFAEAVGWCLAVGLPLVVRRRFPLAVLLACATAFLGLQSRWVPESSISSICLFLALLTAGAWGGDRLLTRAVRGVVVAVMFGWLAYLLSATAWAESVAKAGRAHASLSPITATAIAVSVVNVLYFAAAWVFGDLAWNRERQRDLLEASNTQLAVERDRNARQAVVAERVRIARELHDVVAHHVSVMGLQAAAARRVLDRDPELTRSTLAEVETSARAAMEEMHRLLGVLREDEDEDAPDRSPAPGLADLDALVGSAGGSGLRAAFSTVGEPAPVPDGLQITVYRIVQEAITNTLRHAAATRLDVRLRHLGGALEVEVVDDGRAGLSASAGGMGQVGMRERTALHGGELELGPRSEGGYRVRARFPLTGARDRTARVS